MIVLTLCFFVTAAVYAAAGFGGGSTYNALLALADTDYRIFPSIALLCNLIVVSGGVWHFSQAGHIRMRRIAPWIIASVPAAFVGGLLSVSEVFFTGLLGFALLAAGIKMIVPAKTEAVLYTSLARGRAESLILPFTIGTALGLLAGIVGIGGGIFLAPVLYMLRWDQAKRIAGACCIFIFCNSLAGLAGQALKLRGTELLIDIAAYWPLFLAVLVGGQIGSWMGAVKLKQRPITVITAVLVLYASLRLIWRWSSMAF